MRPMIFAAGISAVASMAGPVMAEDVTRSTNKVVLANGCVYTESLFGHPNEWSLIYKEAGTTATCALTIYGQVAPKPPVEAAASSAVAPVISPELAPVLPPVTQVAVAAPTAPPPAPRPQRTKIKLSPGYVVGVFR